ncbi:hypothetical protein PTSG_03442 [Salpingoeca rosetta]|uniref:protein-tyrosine-phosphatase n=1 Tax=Salpingoeca rosetta (strain ATCC 50818 / BSB-021) TaxID=946362 RepID=F2U576_SALR5|nr:uncharacterized protein PTSG_03442 [Salpingoeca rosetta]EGD82792.1 hypothetical protein PTSG_03442 [Salpingoeca rosetta]|eukprot:XP_004996028.1 hypothetical protein PTSG_03442 [Salpingoeca rosetta]
MSRARTPPPPPAAPQATMDALSYAGNTHDAQHHPHHGIGPIACPPSQLPHLHHHAQQPIATSTMMDQANDALHAYANHSHFNNTSGAVNDEVAHDMLAHGMPGSTSANAVLYHGQSRHRFSQSMLPDIPEDMPLDDELVSPRPQQQQQHQQRPFTVAGHRTRHMQYASNSTGFAHASMHASNMMDTDHQHGPSMHQRQLPRHHSDTMLAHGYDQQRQEQLMLQHHLHMAQHDQQQQQPDFHSAQMLACKQQQQQQQQAHGSMFTRLDSGLDSHHEDQGFMPTPNFNTTTTTTTTTNNNNNNNNMQHMEPHPSFPSPFSTRSSGELEDNNSSSNNNTAADDMGTEAPPRTPHHLQPCPRDQPDGAEYINPDTLAHLLAFQPEHVLLLDCRATLDFNLSHIRGATPVWFSRLMLKRLKRKAGTITITDLPDAQTEALSKRHDANVLTVIYDEDCSYSMGDDNAVSMLHNMLRAEGLQPMLLRGGFKAFRRLVDGDLVVSQHEEDTHPRAPRLQRVLQPHDLSINDSVLRIPASKIFSYLLVGNARQGHSSEFMAEHNITHVLNVSEEPCASNVFLMVQCMQVPLMDGPGHDLLSILPQVIQFIESARCSGGRVLIYCSNGLSRSIAILLAYMISTRKYSLTSAYRTVQTLRPLAAPHVCFLTQLVEYEGIVRQASQHCKRRTRSADV